MKVIIKGINPVLDLGSVVIILVVSNSLDTWHDLFPSANDDMLG